MRDVAGQSDLPRNFTAKAFFEELGEEVDRLWLEKRYDEQAFPEVAERVLLGSSPHRNVSFWDAVKLAFFAGPLPNQVDIEATFGQPPLTVYWHNDFRIELLFWIEGLPDVHLHTQWTFERTARLVDRVGQRRSGPDHSGVSCSTARRSTFRSTCTFLPSIAFAASDLGPVITRRSQLLQMLARAERREELLDLVLHFVNVGDDFSVFHCLSDAYTLLRNENDRNRMLIAASGRHPALVEALRPALIARERREQISALRRLVVNSDLQFFLGLLMNIPERQMILDVVRARHGGSPVERVVA